jgi:signal transduction histidine kinase
VDEREVSVRGRSGALAVLWTAAAGATVVAAAWWLREPGVRYLVVAVAATGVAAALSGGLAHAARGWALAFAAAAAVFVALAAGSQSTLTRIAHAWPEYRASRLDRGGAALSAEFAATSAELAVTALRALDTPADVRAAFRLLEPSAKSSGRGVVLLAGGRPVAWAGRVFADADSMTAPLGIVRGPFYVTLYASATRDGRRAVATAVVHADPPASELTSAIDAGVARREGLHGFELLETRPGSPASGWGGASAAVIVAGRDTLLRAQPVAPETEEARLIETDRVRTSGLPLLALALLFMVAAAWRHGRTLAWRVAPLASVLAAVAVAPLSALSSRSVFLDPTVYYARIGGPFTASAGALAVAAGLTLLALLLALRSSTGLRSRAAAVAVALAVVASGPFLMRALSRGVSPPPGGVTVTLWLAWETALFLAAAVLLVAAAAAGRTALGRARVLPAWLAPALAGGGAVLGSIILEPPGDWPQWYTLLWMLAVAALAFARPHKRYVLAAGIVAACGAATLTWNAGVRGRTALANRDLDELSTPDPDVTSLLARFGASLATRPAPASEPELLQMYMRSDLVGAGFPVALTRWDSRGEPIAGVALDPIVVPSVTMRELIVAASRLGRPVVETMLATPGVLTVLAVPSRGGGATTITVAPRTRLIPDDPYMPLLGLASREHGEPPYQVSLAAAEPVALLAPGRTTWYRRGTDLHGDRLVRTMYGARHAHVEIALRSPIILAQRGALVLLLDVLLLAMLWILSAAPAGAVWRWSRAGLRRWLASYRARLSLALFLFFVLPAVGFALWSYERLLTEDRQSRELVVRETLRSVESGDLARMDSTGARLGTPLLVYRGGLMRWSSDPLWYALAPTGRLLDPASYLLLAEGHEDFVGDEEHVAGERALFGYRTGVLAGGEPYVLGAPASAGDFALDQRRRDLAVLLVLTTVLGALAALALSRAASRALAEPIGALRAAALAIAAGEREPPLADEPPAEFRPVFSAFRRMAADLGASRAALEAAERRTSAVLRNVATGVVALAPEGTVVIANPRAEALLDHPLTPGTPLALAHADVAARVAAFLSVRREEEEFEVAFGERQMQARLTRLGTGGAVLTLDDVTELARAQRVLAWGEMARQVAHEIKNPLTPIRLGIQHLQRAYVDARGDFGGVLDDNAARILAEIDRLDEIARAFSRYGSAPAATEKAEPIDVALVVRDVLALERMGRDSVDWRLDDNGMRAMAYAHADELREVMLNVLENSRHAGAKRVEVRVTSLDGKVQVEVKDDGRGIPALVMPRLFEPHFSTRTSGSGLGLPISRQLVEAWGGAIAVASEEGKGTTVRIELRRAGA